MRCKALQVTVELELQAITCPGVWLCPSGYVTAQFFMLNACAQTSGMKPVFPLLCHEKFVFQKTFYDIRKLRDIDRYLHKEHLYVELIQWINCEVGNVLATFKTNLSELLYPPPWCKGAAVGVDVDLLMEATRRFPGIIAPKLEVSTRTTIEEVLCKNPPPKCKPEQVLIKSKACNPKRQIPIRQKKVCHTYEYHRAKSATPDCHRKNYFCDNFSYQSNFECKNKPVRCLKPTKKTSDCSCGSRDSNCNVCANYKTYFDECGQPRLECGPPRHECGPPRHNCGSCGKYLRNIRSGSDIYPPVNQHSSVYWNEVRGRTPAVKLRSKNIQDDEVRERGYTAEPDYNRNFSIPRKQKITSNMYDDDDFERYYSPDNIQVERNMVKDGAHEYDRVPIKSGSKHNLVDNIHDRIKHFDYYNYPDDYDDAPPNTTKLDQDRDYKYYGEKNGDVYERYNKLYKPCHGRIDDSGYRSKNTCFQQI